MPFIGIPHSESAFADLDSAKSPGADPAIDDHSAVSTIAISPASAKKPLNLFHRLQDTINKGKTLPVYRADLPRTLTLVVALLLMLAAPTSVFAREFRAADTQSEDYPTVQALRYMGHLIAERTGGRLQIQVFHSRQLGEEKETIEQTRAGAIDLNRTNVALIGNFVPA